MGKNNRRKRPTCHACGHPVKGHDGPTGVGRCKYGDSDSVQAASKRMGLTGLGSPESTYPPPAPERERDNFTPIRPMSPNTSALLDPLVPTPPPNTSTDNISSPLFPNSVPKPDVRKKVPVQPVNIPLPDSNENRIASALDTINCNMTQLVGMIQNLGVRNTGGSIDIKASEPKCDTLIAGLPPPPTHNSVASVLAANPGVMPNSTSYAHSLNVPAYTMNSVPTHSVIDQHQQQQGISTFLPGLSMSVPAQTQCVSGPPGGMYTSSPLPDLGGPLPGLVPVNQNQDFALLAPVPGIQDKTVKSALHGEWQNLQEWLFNPIVPNETLNDLQSYVDHSGSIQYTCSQKV